MEKTVVLGKFNVRGEVIATNRPALWRGVRVDYTNVATNLLGVQDVFQAMARGGVVVTEVIPGSPVGLVSVGPGDRVAARFTHVRSVEALFRGRP